MKPVPNDYKVTLRILVYKAPAEEVIVSEEFYFSDITFSKMANVADEFYELIAKLQKIK